VLGRQIQHLDRAHATAPGRAGSDEPSPDRFGPGVVVSGGERPAPTRSRPPPRGHDNQGVFGHAGRPERGSAGALLAWLITLATCASGTGDTVGRDARGERLSISIIRMPLWVREGGE